MSEEEKALALIILCLIKKLKDMNQSINKDDMQIFVYFYQLINAYLGYNYEIYNYSIRSKKLDDDIENLYILGVIKNNKENNIIEEGSIGKIKEDEIISYNDKIDNMFKKLGYYNYSKLEPAAFMHFITKTLKDNYNATEKKRFIDEYMKIKLNYNRNDVEKIYNEMIEKGIIQ